MFRYVLPILAAIVLVTASLIPDDAFARGGRGGGGGFRGGGGGFHGGGVRAGGIHRGGAIHAGRVGGYRGVAGRPGYGVAGRYGRPVAGYGRYYRGYGVGAAAVGAAAAYGAYGAYGYNNNCYDAYGNWICRGRYPY